MKNKKILRIIGILIVLVTIIFFIVSKLNKKQKQIEQEIKELPKLVTSLDIRRVDLAKEFFMVEEVVNKYFEILDENDATGVYCLLNSEYARNNKITVENSLENTYKLKNGFEEFLAKDMYYREISYDSEYQYFIYGKLLGKDYKTIEEIYIIANLDIRNNTFSIMFDENVEMDRLTYQQEMNSLMSSNNNKFIDASEQHSTSITLNKYNGFIPKKTADPYCLKNYLKHYVLMAVYYPEIGYELLDEEYRNSKFGSLEEYKEYVAKNKKDMLNTTILSYNISEKDGYEQYTIVNEANDYYIFKVTGVLEYKVITDVYTVDLEEMTTAYDKSNMQERVAINIQKVVAALNNKDYKYVYGKLSEGFKANKFPTLDSFEKYMSKNVTENVNVEFGEFMNEGETYIYNITLKGNRVSSGEPVNMQIIMQLKENRDFIMSFNIK